MLPKKFRLKKSDKIEYILGSRLQIKNSFFIARLKVNQKANHCFCLVLSKKFNLKGVKRNRLRRQVYNAIRKNLSGLNTAKHYDIALFILKPTLETTYQDLENNLQKLFMDMVKNNF